MSPTTREVEAKRVERMASKTRLYGTTTATPRCTRCQGLMVLLDGHRVHPTCEPEFYALRARANRALGMAKAGRS